MDGQVEISVSYQRNEMFCFLSRKDSPACLILERKREIVNSRKNVGFVVSFKTPVGTNSIAPVIKFLDRSSSIF